MAVKLLDGATADGRGVELIASYDGNYKLERRVYPDPAADFGGGTVSIDLKSPGDATPKPTGVTFSAPTDDPKMVALNDDDEISADLSGATSPNCTVLMA